MICKCKNASRCGNEARCINERGELTCALCAIADGYDSIRISDVPALLKFVRRQAGVMGSQSAFAVEVSTLLGKAPR